MRRTSSSGAGCCRSSTQHTAARHASTSFATRSGRTYRRARSRRGSSELEQAGLLRRTVVEDARPPRVEYSLTEQGESLRALLHALKEWADAAASARSAGEQSAVPVTNP